MDIIIAEEPKDFENVAKRLVALGYLGCHIEMRDGHFWIMSSEYDDMGLSESRLSHILQEAGVRINDKIYGGVLEALACIDQALELAGHPILLQVYEQAWKDLIIYWGEDKPSGHNVARVEKGCGGVL